MSISYKDILKNKTLSEFETEDSDGEEQKEEE
jgi:hypothetical protein